MSGSHKPFDIESKEKQETHVPVGIMNITLGYEGSDPVSGDAGVPLVSTLFNSIKIQKLARLRTLLTAIVSGDPDGAKAILKKDPSLRLEKLAEGDFVTSLTGHQFNLTPYQAALAVDDTQMAEMVRAFFVELRDEEEANRQYDEQCPKGWEAAEEEKWKPIFQQRDRLINAIRDSTEGDITSSDGPDKVATERKGSLVEKELIEFYKLLDATLKEVITPGKRPFNSNLLLEPLRMYDDNKLYKEYFGGRWDGPRALFFIQKVIGYEGIQRFMPVNYVQAHQDFLEITAKKLQNNQPQARGTLFKIIRSGKSSLETVAFYPLRPRGTAGFNFAIFGCAPGRSWGWWGNWFDKERREFRSLCQSKRAGLQNLRNHAETIDLNDKIVLRDNINMCC
ncbi:MAG: hypothetical protein ACYCQI_13190 [Gammaproteobacteria bacterium]